MLELLHLTSPCLFVLLLFLHPIATWKWFHDRFCCYFIFSFCFSFLVLFYNWFGKKVSNSFASCLKYLFLPHEKASIFLIPCGEDSIPFFPIFSLQFVFNLLHCHMENAFHIYARLMDEAFQKNSSTLFYFPLLLLFYILMLLPYRRYIHSLHSLCMYVCVCWCDGEVNMGQHCRHVFYMYDVMARPIWDNHHRSHVFILNVT